MSRKSYTLARDRMIGDTLMAKAGDTVFDCRVSDYGCARDDTLALGIEHTSVTLDPDGGYPFFTVPVRDLIAKDPS